MSAKKTTPAAKKAAPVKKVAAKKAAAPRKPAAPKPAAAPKEEGKKKAPPKKGKVAEPVRLEDPNKLSPLLFKPRVSAAGKPAMVTGMVENVRKSISVLNERSKKKPVQLFTPAMLRMNILPYPALYFQQMLDSLGFRYPCAIEIIAPEHLGSTTFVFDWIGHLIDMGCYAIYCECEGKQMRDSQILRLMDRDPKLALLKLNAVEFTKARSVAQLDETLRQTVKDLRKRCDSNPETKGNPIFFFADPRSALMSKSEAKGNSDWGLAANAKAEEAKGTDEGSNFEHAKHDQAMARWLPAFMEEHNCTVVFVNKQNDKIDMEQKRGPAAYATPSPLKNDTRLGGRALKRLCGYRITMLKLNDIRDKKGDKKEYGHHIRLMLIKNSFGPRARTCDASIYHDQYQDREDYQAPAFSFADRTAAWMASRKFLGTTVENDLYTCDAVGCVAVPPEEFMDALRANPQHLEYLGGQLDIEGYARAVKDFAPVADAGDGDDLLDGDLVDGDDDQPDFVP
jgi:hypothetical protein